jgi:hypothetical protein
MDEKQARRAVAALKRERPEWLPVLRAALIVAERCEPYGGEFAGAWVLDELHQESGRRTWLPNLRLLTTYGFLQKAGESTRGGRRAWYRFANRAAVSRAVAEFSQDHGVDEPQPVAPSSRFRFIGAGDSGQPGSDIARRAGEFTYQPRTWR